MSIENKEFYVISYKTKREVEKEPVFHNVLMKIDDGKTPSEFFDEVLKFNWDMEEEWLGVKYITDARFLDSKKLDENTFDHLKAVMRVWASDDLTDGGLRR